MFVNFQGRVNQIASDYPAVAYLSGMGVVTASVAVLQAARAVQRRFAESNGENRMPPADASPGFCGGALLDGLALLPPTMDLSTCERLGDFMGVPIPEQREKDRNFRQLIRVCRSLPANISHAPQLQNQLDSLRLRVTHLSGAQCDVRQRGDVLNAIDKLWQEAVQLEKRLKAHAGRMRPRNPAESISIAASPAPVDPGELGAPKESMQDEHEGPDGPQRRRVARRHQAASRDIDEPIQPRAGASRAVKLSPDQLQALRTAITQARDESDRGGGFLNRNQDRRLGVAITGVVGGTYPTHLGHAGRQGRQYTVEDVLMRATERMTAWHRDVVREACAAVLDELLQVD